MSCGPSPLQAPRKHPWQNGASQPLAVRPLPVPEHRHWLSQVKERWAVPLSPTHTRSLHASSPSGVSAILSPGAAVPACPTRELALSRLPVRKWGSAGQDREKNREPADAPVGRRRSASNPHRVR